MAQDPHRVGRTEPAAPWPLLGLAGSAAIASIALVLAALDGSPYLGSSLSPWIAVFAVAAFGALFSVPFVANERIVASDPERDEAWERAMVIWGAVALGVLATGVLVITGGGFSVENSLAGAASLILAIEAALILIVLVFWVISG